MIQYKNNQVINSVSNGNGNWLAREEEEEKTLDCGCEKRCTCDDGWEKGREDE